MSTQTTATTIIPVKGAALPEFIATMRTNIVESRKEDGNVSFDAFIVEGGGSEVIVFERWVNQAALDHHATLPHLKAVNEAVERHAKGEPQQYFLTRVEGLPAENDSLVPNAPASRNVMVHLDIKPGQRDVFLDIFAQAMEPSRAAPGNCAFDLYAIEGQENGFILYERWASVEQHEAHLVQPYNDELSEGFAKVLARGIGEGNRWLMRDAAPLG